jgi:hypothetical protein
MARAATLLLAVGVATLVAASPEETLCPSSMPADWLPRCRQGQLLYSPALDGGFQPEVGNGFLATVVGSDVIYSAGFFNGPQMDKCPSPTPWCGTGSHRAAIPPYHVSLAESLQTTNGWGGRVLDVEQATFVKRGVILDGAVRVEERWYAPLQEPSLLVHEIELQNRGSESQAVHFTGSGAESGGTDLEASTVSDPAPEGTHGLVGQNRIPEVDGTAHTRFALAATLAPDHVDVPPHGTTTVYALTAITTSLNATDPRSTVEALLSRYTADGFDQAQFLRAEHGALWRRRAANGHLEVEGDLALAQAVNASLYFIRASVREDWAHGVSPGGLASNAYNGHTFWDQETWMLPPILMLEPNLARSMLQYRADRLQPAREKAAKCAKAPDDFMRKWNQFQVHGAMKPAFWNANPYTIQNAYCQDGYAPEPEALFFPWESAATGVEVNYMDAKIGPWAMFEQHLDGDISLAARQYWYVTGDREWLKDVGFPIANGTASFYNARLSPRGDSNAYDFSAVMGPDEYGFPVKNSAYTNAVTRISLEFAADAAEELGYSGGVYERFHEKAQGLFEPSSSEVPGRPDLVGGYRPEYEGFPFGSPGEDWYLPSPGCEQDTGCVKQADTILLNYPLGVHSDPTVLANDLAFYEHVTDPNGPAMTWAMFAINWFDAGDYEKSANMFPRGYGNVRPPFNVWTEYPRSFQTTGAVNFITGAGGFLQSVIFGASGLRIGPDHLAFDPPPPSATGTSATRFVVHSFHYLGARLREEVTEGHIRFELLEQSPKPVSLCVARQHHDEQPLELGRPIGFPRGRAEIRACRASSHGTQTRRERTEEATSGFQIPNLPFMALKNETLPVDRSRSIAERRRLVDSPKDVWI